MHCLHNQIQVHGSQAVCTCTFMAGRPSMPQKTIVTGGRGAGG